MNALEKYVAKQHLAQELIKQAGLLSLLKGGLKSARQFGTQYKTGLKSGWKSGNPGGARSLSGGSNKPWSRGAAQMDATKAARDVAVSSGQKSFTRADVLGSRLGFGTGRQAGRLANVVSRGARRASNLVKGLRSRFRRPTATPTPSSVRAAAGVPRTTIGNMNIKSSLLAPRAGGLKGQAVPRAAGSGPLPNPRAAERAATAGGRGWTPRGQLARPGQWTPKGFKIT